METNRNNNLEVLSFEQPVMLIFLRNFGCAFCREALSDISSFREHLESNGIALVLVHLNEDDIARKYLKRYDLLDVERIEDRHMRFYADFGLVKGNFNQLFGLQNWIRGFESAVIKGHGLNIPLDDVYQMPGVFLIDKGKIVNKFIHKMASDRPDYMKIAGLEGNKKNT
jgi:thiol-disulfide isomerase/thioredoxin